MLYSNPWLLGTFKQGRYKNDKFHQCGPEWLCLCVLIVRETAARVCFWWTWQKLVCPTVKYWSSDANCNNFFSRHNKGSIDVFGANDEGRLELITVEKEIGMQWIILTWGINQWVGHFSQVAYWVTRLWQRCKTFELVTWGSFQEPEFQAN